MKRHLILGFGIFLLVSSTPFQPVAALTQQSAPYGTYTIGPNGRMVQTQTAYEPAGYLNLSLTLKQPEDMMLHSGYVYVADTGNRRIVRFDAQGNGEVIVDQLNQPTGLHLNEAGELYVADKGDQVVYYYDANFTLMQTYGRPTSPIFGASSPYVPLKVTTGPRGILYIVGEGSTSGLIQLNYAGEFLGFFATNTTRFSWWQAISNFFGVNRASNIPTSPTNLALDDKGSVFTVSALSANQIKKFNIASNPILSISNGSQPISLSINDFGNVLTIASNGIISEYDSYGNLIFEFGGLDQGNRLAGLFVNPVDIFADEHYDLYVLDKATGQIQILQRSEFAQLVHQGLINFKDGIYSLEQWENVLRMNSMFALANASLARGHYRLQAYEDALTYYAIAFDRSGYSEAFWQLRYNWLETNLGLVFVGLIFGWVILKLFAWGQKRYWLTPTGERILAMPIVQTVQQDIRLTKRVFAHPIDTYQDIKHLKRSSWLTASLIYFLVLIMSVLEIYGTGFIFQVIAINRFNLGIHTALVLGGIGLFIASNYLVATITNGEGWFKDIYLATAHALLPYVVITPILTLLSNVLTYNESVVYQLVDGLRYVWSIGLIILMIKEVHNYDVRGLIRNIFLTAFTALMMILVGFLLYVLTAQLINYVESIVREVFLRG
jgi:hypothetical protein